MGYDVTFHPVSPEEFRYFVSDVWENPALAESRLLKLHSNPDEQKFLREGVYGKFAGFKQAVMAGEEEFENTVGFASAAILGYLRPYWYARGGCLSFLIQEDDDFLDFTGRLGQLVSPALQDLFDHDSGTISGNYTSGAWVPAEQVAGLQAALRQEAYGGSVEEGIGESNLESIHAMLDYCRQEGLGFFEVTDLVVPISGEFFTLPDHLRASYQNNLRDFSRNPLP